MHACFEASFEVCKALFKCCFWRVCFKQSYCFAFDKATFYPWRVARSEMGILKGFGRLLVSFDVQDEFFYESLSFEHSCIKESYFVLWYFGCEFYCRVECVSLFNETIQFMPLINSPKGRRHLWRVFQRYPTKVIIEIHSLVAQMINGHAQRHFQLIFNYREKKISALQSQLAII